MATGRREVAFAEATNGRSQHIFRKLEFAEPAQILDRSLRSEAVVANPKYAGKRGLSEAIPNRVVDEWEISSAVSTALGGQGSAVRKSLGASSVDTAICAKPGEVLAGQLLYGDSIHRSYFELI